MSAESSGLWWIVAVVTGAVGAAMAIYGIRQKEPLPLIFGIAISLVPMVASSGWAAALLSIAVGALFVLARKYL